MGWAGDLTLEMGVGWLEASGPGLCCAPSKNSFLMCISKPLYTHSPYRPHHTLSRLLMSIDIDPKVERDAFFLVFATSLPSPHIFRLIQKLPVFP